MSTALYRRYRPDTFADVIGQEHVTAPLSAAIDSGRINHAYLFSGPRGCGKTTSARILARCLNCEQGPTSTPCGQCASCVELARGGAGSIDVIEMDAASHGGVDDARDLRERALFAPVRDRYKVFIIDEAHMVTTQGFNALLKLVEEPPAHVKFVFATTEPEKVIGTIRSRTHHYPFRLVPPEQLLGYLSHLAEVENVRVEDGVLPLVVRAGTGSVRDSLSVLDQLVAGAENGVLSYDRAVALLGFTPGTLLDDAAEALAARDGAGLFAVVERVVESGHAPRRFTEDLLERLRDLIVVLAAGDSAGAVLPAVPADQLERMRAQARNLGAATCSRAADLVHSALAEMAGATSPRLQLELLCARLLLPSGEDGVAALGARVEYLEGVAGDGGHLGAPPASPAVQHAAPPAEAVPPTRPDDDPAASTGSVSAASSAATAPEAPAPAASAPAGPRRAEQSAPVQPQQPMPGSRSAQPAPAPAAAAQQAGGLNIAAVRQRWDEVLQTLAQIKRVTWALVSQNAQVTDLSDTTLTLGFATGGLATAFRTGPHSEPVAQALAETLGLQVRIEVAVLGDEGGPGGPRRPGGPSGTGGGGAGASAGRGGAGAGRQAASGGGTGHGDSRPAAASDAVSRASADWGLTATAVVSPPAPPSSVEAPVSSPTAHAPAVPSTPHTVSVASVPGPPPTPSMNPSAPAPETADTWSPVSPGSPGSVPSAPAEAGPVDPAIAAEPGDWTGAGPRDPGEMWSPGSVTEPAAAPTAAASATPVAPPAQPVTEPAPQAVPNRPAPSRPAARQAAPADTWDAAPPWDDEPGYGDPYDDYSSGGDAGGEHLVGAPLVAKLLGGTVIDEITLDAEG